MKTKLIFRGVYDIVGNDQVGLVVLTDEDKTRQISIICDRNMMVSLSLRREPTVRIDKLLPEVLWTVVKRYTSIDFMLLFTDVRDCEYVAYLYSMDNSVAIPIRASDAVLLSQISGLPVMMDTEVFLKHSTPYLPVSSKVPVCYSLLSDSMLEKELERAIEKEDYKKASLLNEELQWRKKNRKK